MKCTSSHNLKFGLTFLFIGSINVHAKCQDHPPGSKNDNVDSATSIYQKPKQLSYVTRLPRTFVDAGRVTSSKKSFVALSAIAASTLLLIPLDQQISDGVNQFSRFINLDPTREYKTLIGFKLGKTDVKAYEAPQNVNSFLYSVGEGSTSMFIYAGLYLHGIIRSNNRSLQASSELLQSLLAVGITTQFVKRISGRESPFAATVAGGKWSPLTNPKTYQNKVSTYDAFPSGHLATMMATTTVLSLSYPEKKWIKPVGYGLMTLVSLAMINNGVHWTSDYPLALGIGYVFGKVTVNMNRWVKGDPAK